ncbi:hypothetical protein [Nocardia abscessus]|uniref:hypothetical protein n=1 Tax=Nocardia abscessus TaxID=120957 RepID=UPI002453EFA0|nr:hypothetical protein [Nocardia abscessus]
MRERIGGRAPRSHTHTFATHPITGKVICSCGISEIAAGSFDPDYVTACCGSVVDLRSKSIDLDSLVHCLGCEDTSFLIHRDQWQPEVCAACGKTADEAGRPDSWTFHHRTPHSPSISAQSCGRDCADNVEARRKHNGVLDRIARSASGRIRLIPLQ